jgi:hypothetical protein
MVKNKKNQAIEISHLGTFKFIARVIRLIHEKNLKQKSRDTVSSRLFTLNLKRKVVAP